MIDPAIADLREFDWPSLAAARMEADGKSGVLAQAVDWQASLVGAFPGTHRKSRQVIAHVRAQRDDLRRLQVLAEIFERHGEQLVPIVEALEAGREVVVRQSRAAELVRCSAPVLAHWPAMRRPGTVMGPVVVAMAAEVR
ncbi:hypothetical protein [Methylobacterium nodulans]|uniref:Uncharacterized protein n=1 Tax=Methylobacterium nodulans (strain LMG 21967 / CNCM I-2342 / ORS 2060) TaxID=460265 RepID=B8IV49_METNO|nr:hypothetical protein [Methylobacterium nodulans]ACL59107.1 hypothetical protein Mnod_4231 [Methylobacterium nodulans ORS 2060]